MWIDGLTQLVIAACLLGGCVLAVLAALGAVRMPDLPMRMHATTKAGSMGVGLIMLGVALHFQEADVTAKAIALILFILLTSPVAAQVIFHAAYVVGVPMWSQTHTDEMKGQYDHTTRVLRSPEPSAAPQNTPRDP